MKKDASHETFLFVHAAWGGGWEYKQMEDLLTQKGHKVYRPTLTGLGDRSHLANANIDLMTHINDIVNVIAFENLQDIVLVGHSYSGMVVSGVAEKIPERIKQLIFIDAFIPNNGDSVKSINGDEAWNKMMAPKIQNGYVQYPFGEELSEPPHKMAQSLKTFTEPLTVQNTLTKKISSAFILMVDDGKALFETWGASRARQRGWDIYEMEGNHYPMVNQSALLMAKIEKVLES